MSESVGIHAAGALWGIGMEMLNGMFCMEIGT